MDGFHSDVFLVRVRLRIQNVNSPDEITFSTSNQFPVAIRFHAGGRHEFNCQPFTLYFSLLSAAVQITDGQERKADGHNFDPQKLSTMLISTSAVRIASRRVVSSATTAATGGSRRLASSAAATSKVVHNDSARKAALAATAGLTLAVALLQQESQVRG